MKTIIKQNKNSSGKRISCFVLSAFVLLISISVPVFAYTDTSTNGIDFSEQPVPYHSWPTSDFSFGLALGSTTQIEWSAFSVASSEDTVYVFFSSDMGYTFCSPVNTASINVLRKVSGQLYYQFTPSQGLIASDNTNSLYYYSWNPAPSSINVPVFSTRSAGLEAVRDWIDNPPAPVPDPQGPLTISLPAGNALFIDITGLTGVTGNLTTSTSQSHSSPFSWTPTLSYVDAIPTSGTPLGNAINWQGDGGTDVFGRYRNWQCTLIVQPNKKYIAITNPFFNSEYLDPEHEDTNFPITVSVSNYRDYVFVPLNSAYVNGEGVQSSYTDETTLNPVPGGNNTTTGNSINDFLQNIASTISGFFAGAIGAVTTLVNSGTSFIRQLASLYSWLPAPVYAVLTSALILIITIGVIKVFI